MQKRGWRLFIPSFANLINFQILVNTMLHLLYRAYPIFLAMIALEYLLAQRGHRATFCWKESLTSLAITIGHRLTNLLFGAIPIAAFAFSYQHRLLTVSLDRGWAVVLLFLGIEFFYYWYHRAAHNIRWLWATHAVHHSAQYLNLSAAYRLGWTGWLSGNFLFFMPLCWLGFHPTAVATGLGVNLLYQFWLHTELVSKLGFLEKFLNTPSHHRVHHASNLEYLDRNYGGVLIVFDRLFGTFATEKSGHRLIYGLELSAQSYNPLTVALREWRELFQDFAMAKSWGDRSLALFKRTNH
jgi:sterol desaturase/sphingolipid hydroxylase (fatty acid hydroxylase superfamily)